jgi:hypothetical protein
MKKNVVTALIILLMSALYLTSCSSADVNMHSGAKSKSETGSGDKKAADSSKKEAIKDYLKEGEIIACYFDAHLFSAEFGVAKLITPASARTKGKLEVEWLHNSHATEKGKKAWVNLAVTKSHPAKPDELKAGGVVLYGATNKMRRGVVKEIQKDRNKVVLEWFHSPKEKIFTETVDLAIVRIIDEPVMKDPRKK